MKEIIPAALEGERVDRVVALLTGLSRAEVAQLVDEGGVVLGGRAVRARSARVGAGDLLEVEVPPAVVVTTPVPDPSVDVAVVYLDDQLIVVDKPAGLVVHPGAGNQQGTLVHGLLARWPELAGVAQAGGEDRPGIVHRLDKGTSGLLVVARTRAARDALVDQLAGRAMRRRYAALVGAGSRRTRASSMPRSSGPRPTRPGWRCGQGGGRPGPGTGSSTATRDRTTSPSSTAGWRPVAPIRSGCIWPPSGTPSSATPATGAVATAGRGE